MITKSLPFSTLRLSRYRSFGCYDITQYPLTWMPCVTRTGYQDTAAATLAKTGVITYENSFGKRMNYCSHTRSMPTSDYTRNEIMWGVSYGAPGGSCSSVLYYHRLGLGHDGLTATAPIEPAMPALTPALRRTAWLELQPQLNDGFSLLNFLWELRELKELLGLVRSMHTLITRGGVWKSTGSASEVLLGWAFGVAPTLSDLQDLFDLGLQVSKKITDFREQGRKVLPYHHRLCLSNTFTDAPLECGYRRQGQETWYYATLWASYIYEAFGDLEAFVRVYGLNLTLAKVWQALPWSFVVDWVLKIGRFLEACEKDPHMRLKVSGYCDTIKTIGYYSARISGKMASISLPFDRLTFSSNLKDDTEIWRWEKSHYLRTPGEPDTGFAFPVLDSLSGRELVLGGALLRTR